MRGPAGDVVITPFGPERVDELQSLWLSLHAHHLSVAPQLAALGAELPASDFWARRRTADLEALRHPCGIGLAAERDGRLVGYALGYVRRGTGATVWGTPGAVAVLDVLVVAPECRAQGIGTALLEEFVGAAEARGARELELTVVEGNESAMLFYERHGLVCFSTTFLSPISAVRVRLREKKASESEIT